MDQSGENPSTPLERLERLKISIITTFENDTSKADEDIAPKSSKNLYGGRGASLCPPAPP